MKKYSIIFAIFLFLVVDGQLFPTQNPFNQGSGLGRPHNGYCPLEDFTAPCAITIRQCYDDDGCSEDEKCCFTSQRLNGLRQCVQGCVRSLTIQ